MRPGDAVVGLLSPGLRSNGYTLARHVLLERAGLDLGDPAWAGAGHSVADELLRPSVIYAPAVLAARAALGDGLHACAHITGGGIVGNLPRVLPEGTGAVLARAAWEEPPVFAEIQRLGGGGRGRDGPRLQPWHRHGAGRGRRPPPPPRSTRSTAAGQPARAIGEVAAGAAGVRFA